MVRKHFHDDAPGVDHRLVGISQKAEDVGTFLGDGLAVVFMILYGLAVAIPIGFVLWMLVTGPFQ